MKTVGPFGGEARAAPSYIVSFTPFHECRLGVLGATCSALYFFTFKWSSTTSNPMACIRFPLLWRSLRGPWVWILP